MKTVVDIYMLTDGDISVIYYGQDTGANFGAFDSRIQQNGKWLEKRTLTITKIEDHNGRAYATGIDNRGKNFGWLLDYIIKADRWAMSRDMGLKF